MTRERTTINSVGKDIETTTAIAIYDALPQTLKAEYLYHFKSGHSNELKDALDDREKGILRDEYGNIIVTADDCE